MRLAICSAVSERSSTPLRLIRKRPLFRVLLVPSMPTYDVRLVTSASFRIASANAICRAVIAWYETELSATLIPWMTPTSCTGNSPFGMTT